MSSRSRLTADRHWTLLRKSRCLTRVLNLAIGELILGKIKMVEGWSFQRLRNISIQENVVPRVVIFKLSNWLSLKTGLELKQRREKEHQFLKTEKMAKIYSIGWRLTRAGGVLTHHPKIPTAKSWNIHKCWNEGAEVPNLGSVDSLTSHTSKFLTSYQLGTDNLYTGQRVQAEEPQHGSVWEKVLWRNLHQHAIKGSIFLTCLWTGHLLGTSILQKTKVWMSM
jgi:hypothetical protein